MTFNPAYVQASTLICALLSLLFGWMRWRHRDPGAQWFAAGFLLITAIFAFGLRVAPEHEGAHRGASLLGALGIIGLGFGLIEYVGPAVANPRRWRWLIIAPVAVALVWLPFGQLPRVFAHGLVAISLATMSAMAWIASRQEKGTGLVLIAAALLLHPLVLVGMLVAGISIYELRHIVVVPIAVFGMALFAISLTRARVRLEHELGARVQAQEALQHLNESLEHRVAQRTEELHDMVAGLESFNRSVSHDLRGPLGGVATLTRIAIDAIGRGDLPRALPMLDAVAAQADSLGRLVTDLLTLARVGDATLAVGPVDLGQCMQDATEQLRLAGQPVEAVKADARGSVQADAGLLRQVFVNLIGNALKFSRGAAHPQVHVELVPEPDRVVVAVRDNGAGFAPERAKELFEPFRRLHGAAFEGTGLGLTIVRRIVERHGGSVWAEGRPGEGASFYVSLRAAHVDDFPTRVRTLPGQRAAT